MASGDVFDSRSDTTARSWGEGNLAPGGKRRLCPVSLGLSRAQVKPRFYVGKPGRPRFAVET